jgi:CHAT domain-containing protein
LAVGSQAYERCKTLRRAARENDTSCSSEDEDLRASCFDATYAYELAEGRLRDYRILHFATNGLVAGDLANVAEPALMFSPPETATELDDGLLTASEVAQLDLDANWVVLSACNTAAGASNSAQALSGLARAFSTRARGHSRCRTGLSIRRRPWPSPPVHSTRRAPIRPSAALRPYAARFEP